MSRQTNPSLIYYEIGIIFGCRPSHMKHNIAYIEMMKEKSLTEQGKHGVIQESKLKCAPGTRFKKYSPQVHRTRHGYFSTKQIKVHSADNSAIDFGTLGVATLVQTLA